MIPLLCYEVRCMEYSFSASFTKLEGSDDVNIGLVITSTDFTYQKMYSFGMFVMTEDVHTAWKMCIRDRSASARPWWSIGKSPRPWILRLCWWTSPWATEARAHPIHKRRPVSYTHLSPWPFPPLPQEPPARRPPPGVRQRNMRCL